MRSRLGRRLALQPPGIHPALWRFAGECHGFFVPLLSYMGALALIAIAAAALWDELGLKPDEIASPPPERGAGFRSLPALPDRAAAYESPAAGDGLNRQVSLLGLRGGL